MMKFIFQILLVVVVLSIITRLFVLDSFIVKGDSMVPTLNDGDYVFINRIIYKFHNPKRGDIVVVKVKVDGDSEKTIIKRIIGLPEERITIKDDSVLIRHDRIDEGQILEEPYLINKKGLNNGNINDINLDPQEYFLLGDNRSVSLDSKNFGTINRWEIKGKIWFLFNIGNLTFKVF